MALSPTEQYMLELINRARLDPLAEAARYGLDLNDGLAAGTIDDAPLQVLAQNDTLSDSSEAHSAWMLENNVFSHTGEDGTSAGNRMANAGYSFNGEWSWAENLAWTGTTGALYLEDAIEKHHEGLYRSAGHRTNTFSEDMREIGLAQVAGTYSVGSADYNSSMLTENFAQSGDEVFVTGVAYRDGDADNFYSIGEGQSGVVIRIADAQDTSADAGGYAVAIDPQNTAKIFVEVGGAEIAAVQMDMSDGNAKLDVVTAADGSVSLNVSVDTQLLSGVADATLLGAGDLRLDGSDSDNVLMGNSGDNVLYGLRGSDFLYGEDGADKLVGGGGSDQLFGGIGDDFLRGGGGQDRLLGGNGDDALTGNGGKDRLFGGNDNDTLAGGGNRDKLFGQLGDDILNGGNGRDVLKGGSGDDILDGGRGNDKMVGGLGADTFVFNAGDDRIRDFDVTVDQIEISAQLLGTDDLSALMSTSGGDTTITFDNGHSLTIDNFTDTGALLENIHFI